MSTSVALSVDGMSLSEAMGMSSTPTASTLARVAQVHNPITVSIGDDEKITVPVGAFKVTMPDGEVVYTRKASIRVFAQRQQWQRWDSASETMNKSLMSNSLNGDLKDTTGKFNLGRPSGYIEDFQSLPEATKNLIRSIKRVKVTLGMIILDNPMDYSGNPLQGYEDEIPFVMDIKNTESMKSLDNALSKIMSKKLTPVEHTVALSSAKRELPTGAKYAVLVADLGSKVNFQEQDSATLQDFLNWVEYSNSYVSQKWQENSSSALSASDADLVSSIVEVQEAE
jgi:hypothetical protein